MSRRIAAAAAAVSFIVSGCGADVVGPGVPECTGPDEGVATATIMQLQSVPEARWGPCIEELKVGWQYVAQLSESGRSVFWLDSDRLGERFVEVELAAACDPSGAVPQNSSVEGVARFALVEEEPVDLEVAVVPVAPRHVGDARALAASIIGTRLKGRTVLPVVDEAEGLAAERIQDAVDRVGVVLVLDDAQVANGTVELRRSGHDARLGITVERALDEIEGDLGPPRYRAQWFHTFTGGCITYRFDAEGAGVESVVRDVTSALGFYPLDLLREGLRGVGLDT